MNYFAHAIRFLDRPWFICGVSVPDWLNVVDRRCRVRKRTVLQALPGLRGEDLEIAFGILQHLDDDHWFHGTAAFFEVNNQLSRLFRETLGPDETWHCGFLGHIVLELLIDSELILRNQMLLDRYYDNFQQIDAERVARVVSSLATRPADDLSRLIPLFVGERFLEDYTDDDRLLHRLNQVMRRVTLPALPEAIKEAIAASRIVVANRLPELLPPPHFVPLPVDESVTAR